MNRLKIRLTLILGLTAGVAASACDKNNECIADCDPAPADESSGTPTDTGMPTDTEMPTATATPTDTGGDAEACADNTEAATEFLVQNNECETVLDCTVADGICYDGELRGACGTVAFSASADRSAWDALAADLAGTCECGADPCGSTEMCTDAGTCAAVFLSDEYCPSLERDVQTFLDANKSCETNEDCQLVASTCHVDDCSAVTLNNDADVEAWARLDQLLSTCDVDFGEPGDYCNFVGDCGFEPVCNDQGQCVSDF